jgi:hypothetical protein
MGITLHFAKPVPEAIDQALSSEARYIITSFSKESDLQKIYGLQAKTILADCRALGENPVRSVAMILSADLKKLVSAVILMRNGDSFLINERYALVNDQEARKAADNLIREGGDRIFEAINK